MLKGIGSTSQASQNSNTVKETGTMSTAAEHPVMTTANTRPAISEEQIQEVLKRQSEGTLKPARPFSSDYEGDLNDPIEAIPLQSTSVENVRVKNSDYMARWVHKDSEGLGAGVSFWEGKGIGARLAIPEDVEIPGMKPKDGHFSHGSLILMVFPKSLYQKLLKAKDQRAYIATQQERRLAIAKTELNAALTGPTDPSLKDVKGNQLDKDLSGKEIGIAKSNKGLSVFMPGSDESAKAGL